MASSYFYFLTSMISLFKQAFLLVHVENNNNQESELSRLEGWVLERRVRMARQRKRSLDWEKVFNRMHHKGCQLGRGFDFSTHDRVYLSRWVCDGHVVHEENERTQQNEVQNTKRNEEFAVKCEEPVGLWLLLRRRRGWRRLGRFLWQNVLECVQHFDSAKGSYITY